jgi:outer membrane receptor for ferric coprogen and ferric-rhodotorulic acid
MYTMNTRRINSRILATLTAAIALALAPLAAQQAPAPASRPAAAPLIPDDDNLVELAVFVVEGERDTGYESTRTTAGLRTVQELKNVPSSISIMNATFISDLGAQTMDDMSRWFVTGETNPNPDIASGDGRPLYRGVQSNYAMRNGWIWYTPVDSYSVERVEQIRGPNAFLYGEADLGGVSNTVTKQGLFTKSFQRVRLIAGSNDLYRGEIDVNQILVPKVLSLRASAVYSKNKEWYDYGKRDFKGIYLAATYRPTRTTTIRVSGEMNWSERVTTTGLFQQYYGFLNDDGSQVAAQLTNGTTYIPALGLTANNRVAASRRTRGSGSNLTLVDTGVVPREWQFRGPAATYSQDIRTLTVEVEQKITTNLSLQLSANWMQSKINNWNASGRAITRDLSPTLPGGAANPYYGELYTEYYRTHQRAGNIVRDMRASLVYNWDKFRWMKQQFVFNVQQHQDNPGQRHAKLSEYADINTWTAADRNTVSYAPEAAALAKYRGAFNNNRFYRRFYLRDGDSENLIGDMHATPGLSQFYPDYGVVYGTGAVMHRRFYMPSYAIGAFGAYLNNRVNTMIGYRKDKFHMRNQNGLPILTPGDHDWTLVAPADKPGFSKTTCSNYSYSGPNLGIVVHLNDYISLNYNYAKSYRPSLGVGGDGFIWNTSQGIPYGEGWEAGMRLTLFRKRVEISGVYYDNYQPNARVAPSMNQAVKDEMNALFVDAEGNATWNEVGRDTEQLTTKGVEIEMIANITKNWRLIANYANNKMEAENRVPQLKHFQALARQMGAPVPELDATIARYPESMPTGGYTKNRANVFTRYDFRSGALKGLYVGGGLNWRDRTYRGTVQLVNKGPFVDVWGPSYTVFALLAGYRTKLMDWPVTIALNVDNLLDKDYYRTASTSAGSWGAPRTFKLTTSIEF